ncbi:hypothetical protein pEaSNUABM49_00220 [Erwinia phage pEa_SNUABM_49]|nr:hypothetical protein pEaSNUABM49_00220 [Erwinia phage pEa_SNUABM_49]
MYISVVTGKKQDDDLVKCTVAILKFKNMDEVTKHCTELLNNPDTAYIHTQTSTYNNYINAEVKTMNDHAAGVYEQIRYTKDKQYINNSICCKTIVL